MCGIIGSVSKKIGQEQFIAARDKMINRGPDDAGYFADDERGVKLGHRRLSILDLSSAGHQPMFSADGRLAVVFNGEVYNYLELKEELKAGYEFKTKTDTEVILAAYLKWGEACVEKFNGMFALGIYDKETGEIFCARDRFGIKPFYYYLSDELFAFASEIKSLLALGVPAKANEAVIYDYLAFGYYDHSLETFFEKIVKLGGGHWLKLDQNKKITIKRYWDLDAPKLAYEKYSYRELQEKFKNLLADSVKLRFRSDVPVGVNVSSGLDSTSLLFFSEKATAGELELFSMCLNDDHFDECRFVKNVLNEEQKKRWHTSYLEPKEVFSLAEKLNEIQDEPFGGIPTIAYMKLNEQAAREKTVVLLEGQGVDEILAGYGYYQAEYLRDLIKAGKFREIFNYIGFLKRNGSSWSRAALSVLSTSRADTAKRSQDLTKQLATKVLADSFRKKYAEERRPIRVKKFASDLLNAQYRDIMFTKLPRVLRFNDRVSMNFSRELRLPYLDYRLVELAFFLPSDYKIIPGRSKRLLRDAMSGIIPEAVNAKGKVAFGAVQTPWLRRYFKKEVMARLNSPSFKSLPYFNHDLVISEAEKFFSGAGDNSFFIWQWLNLAIWHEKYIK